MPKAKSYKCECGHITEVIYNDSEAVNEEWSCENKDCDKIAILDFLENICQSENFWGHADVRVKDTGV